MQSDLRATNQLILHKQHLSLESRTENIVQTVQDIGGLHAQLAGTPYLSLFIRMGHFKKEMLENALYRDRNLARIKSVRRTLYIFPKHMISAVFAATRRLLEVPTERYMKYFGISQQAYDDIAKSILIELGGRGLTTKTIKERLGTQLDVSLYINLMCDQGLLIRGESKAGWKSSLHTYYPFEVFFPDVDLGAMEETVARQLLVKQYIAAFGPVTEKDISWWTGFSKGEIKLILKALENDITEINIEGFDGVFYVLISDEAILKNIGHSAKPSVHLLPVLDPFIMGYKDRTRFLEDAYYANVFDAAGNGTSTILVDGKIVGVWDFAKEKPPFIKIFLFEKLKSGIIAEILCKAEEIGQFIADEKIGVVQCHSMVSLARRTAGGYQSPLKDSGDHV